MNFSTRFTSPLEYFCYIDYFQPANKFMYLLVVFFKGFIERVLKVLFFVEPLYVCMTAGHVVAASKEAFYIWQYKNVKKFSTLEVSHNIQRKRDGMEK